MEQHPFGSSVTGRTILLILLVIALCIEYGFLRQYTQSPVWICLVSAAYLSAFWGMTGYLTWRLLNWLPVWQAQIFWTFFSQAAITSSWHFLFSLTGLQEKKALLSQLPFHLLSGVLYSFIILLWYRNQQYQRELALLSREPLHTDIQTKEDTLQKQENLIQHISIKNGTRIHVISIEEIHYIEACGDYVTLFTSSGQYVKEQTMKYFETHLPAHLFIRIHRSYILHIQQILRIEQFGKESYQIKLKNGNVLRASSNGYKLLKHRLKL